MAGGSEDQSGESRRSAGTDDATNQSDEAPCDTCGDPMASLRCSQCTLSTCYECVKYCDYCDR
eukprot:7340439-Karenia_brevis.AAC.1